MNCPRCRKPIDALAPNSHGGRQCPHCYTVVGMMGQRVVGRTFAAYGRTQSVSVNAANSGYVCVNCGRPLANIKHLTICRRCREDVPVVRPKRTRPSSPRGRIVAATQREHKVEERLRRQAR